MPAGGRYRLKLLAGYFDESTDESTEGFTYTVAGFIASQHATVVLELRWRDLLKEYDLAYFKASELNALEGQFKKFRDDPSVQDWKAFSATEKKKQREIKTGFTDCIVSCGGLFGIGASLVLTDYERILREYSPAKSVLPLPYYLCTGFVLMEAGFQMYEANKHRRDHDKALLKPIFDSHKQYSGRIKQDFEAFCAKNPISATYLLPPDYESDTTYLALQAADEFAFEVRKLLVRNEFKQNLPERVPMTRLKESGSVARLYKLDYTSLKAFVDAQEENAAIRQPTDEDPLWEMKDIFLARLPE
jgi:hypothetical protein